MGEHVLPGKIVDNIACRAGRFHCPIIRVWKAPIPLYDDNRIAWEETASSRFEAPILPFI